MVRPVGQKPSKGAPYYAYGIYLKEKGSNYGEQYINKAHNIFLKTIMIKDHCKDHDYYLKQIEY